MNRLPRFAGLAIFGLAMSALMLEVALTRIFSLITYYHFTYLIIGLALLGFGAAGTVLTINRRFAGEKVDPGLLADCTWMFGLVVVISFLAITKTSFDGMAFHQNRDFSQFFGLLMLLVFATTPFFFAGLCIGYLVSKSGEQINRIYFCDLVGAGCGSLGALLAINRLGAVSLMFWIGAAACVLALLIGGRAGGRFRFRYPLTALFAATLGVVTLLDDNAVPVQFPPSKHIDAYRTEHRWHVVARVDVKPPDVGYPTFGGSLSRVWDRNHPPLHHRLIYQDGVAPTGIVDLQHTTPQEQAILGYYLQGVAYVLRPQSRILVIGPGGGIDVAIALHHGSQHVTAVDINPRTIDFVKHTYNDFAGNLYNRPDVTVIVAEGRHFLTATNQKFDVIQLSGVDTFTALASGAYALSENYLYTEEAIGDFLDHLSSDGVLSFSRWLFTPPRETLRLAVTARTTLASRGVTDPSKHIMVIAAPGWEGLPPWAETMIKTEPFTIEEVARLREWCTRMRFDVIYDPWLPYAAGGPFDAIEGTVHYGPAVDAKIFSEALRVPKIDDYINDYYYNIRPTNDDSPFFFNFYRMRSLLRPFEPSIGGYSVTRLPTGLLILLTCSIQIIILGALLILWPMRTQAAGLRGRPGAIHVLIYFAAIGLAFIAVEIMLLQKLMVFLGGPVYSMSVTLFSLLVFCGIGSFLAKRFTHVNPRWSGVIILAVVASLILATTWFLNHRLDPLRSLDHTLRCLVAMAVLLPVGLFMGMPFPTGMRLAERLSPGLVPWAWCVNACATVLGSVASMLAGTFFGFTWVLLLSAAIYGVAMLAILLAPAVGGAVTAGPRMATK